MKRNLEIPIAGDSQAHARALNALRNIPGVEDVSISRSQILTVAYTLSSTSAGEIVDIVEHTELMLALPWLDKIRLKLHCYREGILKDDLNNEMGWDSCVREIYVSRYRHRRHGRRDDRPHHWRQYSSRTSNKDDSEASIDGR